jgi:hypothetical protein
MPNKLLHDWIVRPDVFAVGSGVVHERYMSPERTSSERVIIGKHVG